MKFKSYFTLSVIAMLAITACKKNSPLTPTPTPAPTDVYVAGTVGTYPTRAAYWKNGGEPIFLTDGTTDAGAAAIATDGTHVYVVGYSIVNGAQVATCWIDGTPDYLTTGYQSQASSVVLVKAADGKTHVYVDGYANSGTNKIITIATLWKNVGEADATAVPLASAASSSRAAGMTTDGPDVYIAGTTNATGGTDDVATYWKNDAAGMVVLADASVRASEAEGITVYNNHVYVSGYTVAASSTNYNTVPTYWEDGKATQLPFVSTAAASVSTGGIAANSDGIYLCGNDGILPVYWKNGDKQVLSNSTWDTAYASSILISGANIYVTGSNGDLNNGVKTAGYWENGTFTPLSQATSVGGIAVN